MKKIWIAIALISISLGLCIWEQNEISSFCNTVDAYCQSENYNQSVKEITKLWNEKNNTLYAFSQHDLLEHLAENIEQLSSKKEKDEIKSALSEIRAQNNVYYQNHKMTFSNIF